GGDGAEELAAHRRIVEQVPDLDAGAGRAVPGPDGRQFAAVAGEFGPARLAGRPRLQRDLGDAADGGEGLAAEAERADAEQVVGGLQLAGGVAGEGEGQILGGDAAAVIGDADQLRAALLDLDVDARAAGIDAVLQQLLEDAGRALDDLAGGDFGDDIRGQLTNTRHERPKE